MIPRGKGPGTLSAALARSKKELKGSSLWVMGAYCYHNALDRLYQIALVRNIKETINHRESGEWVIWGYDSAHEGYAVQKRYKDIRDLKVDLAFEFAVSPNHGWMSPQEFEKKRREITAKLGKPLPGMY